jgi:hypothetical protein
MVRIRLPPPVSPVQTDFLSLSRPGGATEPSSDQGAGSKVQGKSTPAIVSNSVVKASMSRTQV